MEKLEIHLFHGFLGLPSDWQLLTDEMSPEVSADFICHDLWADLKELDSQGKENAEDWSLYKWKNINKSSNPKVLIGYSMGGRLLMQSKVEDVDNLKAVFYIASGPGLKTVNEKEQRVLHDAKWSERFLQENWKDLLSAWFSQNIFKNSKKIDRKESDFSRKYLAMALEHWSLAKQHRFTSNFKPSFWICGGGDPKYKAMTEDIKSLVGNIETYHLPDSGHRCLVDNPVDLAKFILKKLKELEKSIPLRGLS